MTDENGNFVPNNQAGYLPFGGWRTEPTAELTDRGYTSHKHNNMGSDDIGLIYMNARYYVPGIARFASADTIVPNPANPQSYNRYSYVRNNPLNFIDPTGHVECGLLGNDSDSAGCEESQASQDDGSAPPPPTSNVDIDKCQSIPEVCGDEQIPALLAAIQNRYSITVSGYNSLEELQWVWEGLQDQEAFYGGYESFMALLGENNLREIVIVDEIAGDKRGLAEHSLNRALISRLVYSNFEDGREGLDISDNFKATLAHEVFHFIQSNNPSLVPHYEGINSEIYTEIVTGDDTSGIPIYLGGDMWGRIYAHEQMAEGVAQYIYNYGANDANRVFVFLELRGWGNR